MVIGLSTACFNSRCETEDCFQIINELGGHTCEVFLRTFYEYRPEFAKKYSPLLEGVKVNSVRVQPTNFEAQLLSASRRVRGDGFYWLDQVLRSAQLFGANSYVYSGLAVREDLDYLADRFNEVIGFCSRYGVGLVCKNVCNGTYNRPGIFKQLKSRCSQLSGALDLRQALLSAYPWQMYAKDMEGSISQVYLSDEGVEDYKQIFKVLKDNGFDGTVIIENQNFSDVSELKTCINILKDIIL